MVSPMPPSELVTGLDGGRLEPCRGPILPGTDDEQRQRRQSRSRSMPHSCSSSNGTTSSVFSLVALSTTGGATPAR
jgi:hypothetical protein